MRANDMALQAADDVTQQAVALDRVGPRIDDPVAVQRREDFSSRRASSSASMSAAETPSRLAARLRWRANSTPGRNRLSASSSASSLSLAAPASADKLAPRMALTLASIGGSQCGAPSIRSCSRSSVPPLAVELRCGAAVVG